MSSFPTSSRTKSERRLMGRASGLLFPNSDTTAWILLVKKFFLLQTHHDHPPTNLVQVCNAPPHMKKTWWRRTSCDLVSWAWCDSCPFDFDFFCAALQFSCCISIISSSSSSAWSPCSKLQALPVCKQSNQAVWLLGDDSRGDGWKLITPPHKRI